MERHHTWRPDRAVRWRTANPCTSVRIRWAPPETKCPFSSVGQSIRLVSGGSPVRTRQGARMYKCTFGADRFRQRHLLQDEACRGPCGALVKTAHTNNCKQAAARLRPRSLSHPLHRPTGTVKHRVSNIRSHNHQDRGVVVRTTRLDGSAMRLGAVAGKSKNS
jgi:hypothetical protein